MKLQKPLLLGLAACLLGAPLLARAYEGDWKRGNVYYRMVCTECHKIQAGGAIGPITARARNGRLPAGRQARQGKDSLRYYVGKPYVRASRPATRRRQVCGCARG